MGLPRADQVGWYGKLPAFGDFASRRLPLDFVRDFDAWLARSILASRELLGETWTQTYLDCPIWRFLLPPGVLGAAQSETWAGVMMASVDRVGRHFPFTIAAAFADAADPSDNLPALARWWAGLEDVALDALQNDLDGDAVDEELAAQLSGAEPGDADAPGLFEPGPGAHEGGLLDDLDFPESDALIPDFPDSAQDAGSGFRTGTGGHGGAESGQAAWSGAGLPGALLQNSGFAAAGHSLWSVAPSYGAAPILAAHCVAGMPDPFQFIAMLRTRPARPRSE